MRLPPTRSKPRRRRDPCMKLDGQGLLVLVDPVRTSGVEAAEIGRQAKAAGGRGLLVGASVHGGPQNPDVARALRAQPPRLPAAAALVSGMRAVYLGACRGAARPVPLDIIPACRSAVPPPPPDRPLFVGGGIRTPEQARAARAAGADFVVIGTVVEEGAKHDLRAFVEAAR